jgi:hypothetical protein
MGRMRDRFAAFKKRHGRGWVFVLIILCISFALDRWEDIDFAVNHRSTLGNLAGRIGNVLFSDWFLIPAFVVVTVVILWLYSRPLPQQRAGPTVSDVIPGERIITEEQTTSRGSTSRGVMGFEDAAPTPKTVEAKAAIPGAPEPESETERAIRVTGEIDPEMQQPKCRPSHGVNGDQVVLVLENREHLTIPVVRCVVRGMHIGPFQTDVTNPFPASEALQIGPPKLDLWFPRDFDGADLRPGADHWVAWYDTFDTAHTGPSWTEDHRLALYRFRTIL